MAFVTRKFAHPGQTLAPGKGFVPMAPGAVDSPQEPGEVPDKSSVPERGVLPVDIPEEGARRPLTEYATSQTIMGVYEKEGLDPLDPERFTQAPPSYEERRKATPELRPTLRPLPGYALSVSGQRLSRQLEAIEAQAQAEQPIDPAQ
ncbi:MAG TPA: hypothetical protein VKZ61_04405 [Thermomicrobiales bacterium]|jgi:hypothetical protein|nr:hypothetical protein [Thermomicrobiales bacterium]